MKSAYWVIIIAVVLIVAGGVYYAKHSSPANVYLPGQNLPVTVVSSSTPQMASSTPTKAVTKSAKPQLTWKTYSSSEFGFSFEYPMFTSRDFVAQQTSYELDFNSWNKVSSLFDPDFSFYDNSNAAELSLQDWFEKNIDYKGLLLSNGIYHQLTFNSGVTAMVLVDATKAAPSDYLKNREQLNGAAFFELPDGKHIVTLSVDAQENNLSQFGYSSDINGYNKLINQVLATVKFTQGSVTK